jgi:PPOX class probable F420-dependent enzyme
VTADEARARLALARSAHLATADRRGRPHVVPICFALERETLYTAIDNKPKGGGPLRRLENITANPRVSVLADHYEDEDWAALWWVRADGVARIVGNAPHAIELLRARYEQYRESPPFGPVIAIAVERWSGWAGSGH